MASSYSTNLAIELIGTGDQAGTWGVTTNTNLGTLIEQAISGYVTQTAILKALLLCRPSTPPHLWCWPAMFYAVLGFLVPRTPALEKNPSTASDAVGTSRRCWMCNAKGGTLSMPECPHVWNTMVRTSKLRTGGRCGILRRVPEHSARSGIGCLFRLLRNILSRNA